MECRPCTTLLLSDTKSFPGRHKDTFSTAPAAASPTHGNLNTKDQLLPPRGHSHLQPDLMLAAPSIPKPPTFPCPHRDAADSLQPKAERGLPAPPGSTHPTHSSHWVLGDRLPAPSSCPGSRWGCQFISSPAQTNSRASEGIWHHQSVRSQPHQPPPRPQLRPCVASSLHLAAGSQDQPLQASAPPSGNPPQLPSSTEAAASPTVKHPVAGAAPGSPAQQLCLFPLHTAGEGQSQQQGPRGALGFGFWPSAHAA